MLHQRKNDIPIVLEFLPEHNSALFVMTLGAQTIDKISVFDFASNFITNYIAYYEIADKTRLNDYSFDCQIYDNPCKYSIS